MEKYVEINGSKNYVYCYGNSSIVIVLLSGSGVPFPSIEYEKLAKTMAQTYQVIGVEKLGYGHSDIAEDNRYIDDIVHEYRCVLQELGIETPVILAAHSMGFLEAIRWGQMYPSEIRGILGIDPAIPECYREFNVEDATNKLVEMSNDEHLRKEMADVIVKQIAEEQDISSIEKKKLEALALRNLANKNWISEAKNIRESVNLVEENNPYLQIPMLFFISNGEGTTIDKESWIKYSLQYLENIKPSQYQLFDYPHNLYKFVYEDMAQIVKNFITKYIG